MGKKTAALTNIIAGIIGIGALAKFAFTGIALSIASLGIFKASMEWVDYARAVRVAEDRRLLFGLAAHHAQAAILMVERTLDRAAAGAFFKSQEALENLGLVG